MLRAGRQYNCNIKETDFKAESLIQVLSLQAITQLKIRLTADNLISYSKTSSFSQKTVFLSIFINKKNLSILSLIKNIQKFNSQYKQISSQFHRKSEKNLSFILHENEILKKTNYMYISHQKTI